MSKYNIGDEINISGKIKITGIQSKLDGSTVYQIANIPAPELDKMAAPAKAGEAPKPAFVEGGYAKVTGNTNHHPFKIGETITLLHKYGCKDAYWEACASTKIGAIWNVKESDMTPCEAPKAKTEPPKTEPVKQEPVKLYCVKSYKPGEWITQGKVYEADAQFRITFDDGYKNSGSFASLKDLEERNPSFAACLIPLVRRHAKVGEWVYMLQDDCMRINKKSSTVKMIGDNFLHDPTGKYKYGISVSYKTYLVLDGYTEPANEPAEPPKQPDKPANLVDRAAKVGERIYINKAHDTGDAYTNGDICEVVKLSEYSDVVYIKTPTGRSYHGCDIKGTACVSRSEYLVVEEKPKYYNGKVICIKDCPGFTRGKLYEFVNGIVIDNDGSKRPLSLKTIESLDDEWTKSRFIPFVG